LKDIVTNRRFVLENYLEKNYDLIIFALIFLVLAPFLVFPTIVITSIYVVSGIRNMIPKPITGPIEPTRPWPRR